MTQTFEPAGMEELLTKGRRSGQVSAEDVLAAIPEAETSRERLSAPRWPSARSLRNGGVAGEKCTPCEHL